MKPASTRARGAAGRGGAPRRPRKGKSTPGSRASPGDGGPHLRPPPRPASLRPPGPAPLLARLPPLSFLSAELQNGDQTSGGERGRLPDIPVV